MLLYWVDLPVPWCGGAPWMASFFQDAYSVFRGTVLCFRMDPSLNSSLSWFFCCMNESDVSIGVTNGLLHETPGLTSCPFSSPVCFLKLTCYSVSGKNSARHRLAWLCPAQRILLPSQYILRVPLAGNSSDQPLFKISQG